MFSKALDKAKIGLTFDSQVQWGVKKWVQASGFRTQFYAWAELLRKVVQHPLLSETIKSATSACVIVAGWSLHFGVISFCNVTVVDVHSRNWRNSIACPVLELNLIMWESQVKWRWSQRTISQVSFHYWSSCVPNPRRFSEGSSVDWGRPELRLVSKQHEASLRLDLKTPGDLTKPERLCTLWENWSVYIKLASTKQRDSSMRWKMWSSCACVYLLWLLPPQRRKHGLATLCQRRLTHLSIMTFWMILTFRLSRVYQHHSGADIYLLLLLSERLQVVCSLRCAHLVLALLLQTSGVKL